MSKSPLQASRKSEAAPGGNRLPANRPLLYAITGGKNLSGGDLASYFAQAAAASIDLIQIREPGLSAGELLAVTRAALEAANGTSTRILVNDRLDVALAAGADGVHLPVRGFPLEQVRRECPGLLIGVSTHTLGELRHAADHGADFAVFGPVFAPRSKPAGTPPVGLDRLAEAIRAVTLPVLALGGLSEETALPCLRTGAAGLAAITLFQQTGDLRRTVRKLRSLADSK